MKMEDFSKEEKVKVLINNPQTGCPEWREGVVKDRGMICPKYGRPYAYFKIKYLHTYWKTTRELFKEVPGVPVPVFDSLEGEFYTKSNTALFFMDGEIQKL